MKGDEEDLLESMKVLLNILHPKTFNSSAPTKLLKQKSSSVDFDRDEENKVTTMTTGQIGGMIGGLIKMMPMKDISSESCQSKELFADDSPRASPHDSSKDEEVAA